MENGSLVAARFVSYALLLTAAGLPFHAVIDRRSRFDRSERLLLAAVAASAAIASLWWCIANIAAMAGLPPTQLDRETFFAVLEATPLAALLKLRLAALGLILLLLIARPKPVLLAPIGLLALASAAWAGHTGAGEGIAGMVLRVSDILHLGAAALWLGALLAFSAGIFRRRDEAAALRSLSDFARAGTILVAVLFASGLANAWLISGGILTPSLWSGLIGLKIGLFAAMLGLAAQNRWRLVPAFAAGRPGAAARLRRSLHLETACGFAIVAVVAMAGQLAPQGA